MNHEATAFSLVELLSVITVISILVGLGAASLGGFGNSQSLKSGADVVATLGLQARQYAVAHNSITALVVAGAAAPKEHALRSFAIFELSRNSNGEILDSDDWKQITQWKKLPAGIVVDPSSKFLLAGSASASPSLPGSLVIAGITTQDFAAQMFFPSGRLMNENSPNIKIVNGHMEGGNLVVTGSKNGATPLDYVDICFISSTGQTKVFRP